MCVIFYKSACVSHTFSIDINIIILDFLDHKLEFDLHSNPIVIDRAHRLGKSQRLPGAGARRPIIVAFRDYVDTERIIGRAYLLKNSRFGIDRDYPKEIAAARQVLWPRFKELRSQSKNVSLQYPARLVLNGRVIEDALPDWFEVLKASRIVPYESARVQAANSRFKQRRDASQVTHDQSSTTSTTNTSLRPVNMTTSGLFHAEMRPIDNSRGQKGLSGCDILESAGPLNASRSENVSMSDDSEADVDDDDDAFYSSYVARMGSNQPSRPVDLSVNAVPRSAPSNSIFPRTVLPVGQNNNIGCVTHSKQVGKKTQTSEKVDGTGAENEHSSGSDRTAVDDTMPTSSSNTGVRESPPLPPSPPPVQ